MERKGHNSGWLPAIQETECQNVFQFHIQRSYKLEFCFLHDIYIYHLDISFFKIKHLHTFSYKDLLIYDIVFFFEWKTKPCSRSLPVKYQICIVILHIKKYFWYVCWKATSKITRCFAHSTKVYASWSEFK